MTEARQDMKIQKFLNLKNYHETYGFFMREWLLQNMMDYLSQNLSQKYQKPNAIKGLEL